MTPDPISPYAVAKLASERYMISFYRCYGLETVALRYFNIFGSAAGSLVALLRGAGKIYYADAQWAATHNVWRWRAEPGFTYIDNAVDANLLACKAPAGKVAGKVFNVATGRRVTLNETFKLLQNLTSYNGSPLHAAERGGDIKHSLADISQAEQCLGYKPAVDFEEGLRRTVDWYLSQTKAAGA